MIGGASGLLKQSTVMLSQKGCSAKYAVNHLLCELVNMENFMLVLIILLANMLWTVQSLCQVIAQYAGKHWLKDRPRKGLYTIAVGVDLIVVSSLGIFRLRKTVNSAEKRFFGRRKQTSGYVTILDVLSMLMKAKCTGIRQKEIGNRNLHFQNTRILQN